MILKPRKLPVKKLRQDNIVPGVIYGKDFPSISIQVDEKELISAYKQFGQSLVFAVELNGKGQRVYIKDLQYELLSNHKITHFDLVRVSKDSLITADIPVIIKGREVIEDKKLFVEFVLQTVKAEYPATMGVANFEFDVSEFDINDAVYVKDIVVEEGINILDNPEQIILIIKEPVMIEDLEGVADKEHEERLDTDAEESQETPLL
ncbi:MAG: 50S ribosomal protein L25 [Bacilli bacterium]|nr:50S ribosomal protein L25 [Bacilli bacterium]MDD4077327.1 50S ribosomal protein L25 [Bacilli bacterium]MDD4389039.1 50S ribosomal protein L25 [Bacilli bacterium]